MNDEREIRTLIERWAKAVHAGDMDGVLADHADDIVMFDVPPPANGVRGISAYRATWLPFFEFQRQGARFEIVSLDLTAGENVAFAHALLLCGTEVEKGSGKPPAPYDRPAQAGRALDRDPRASFVSRQELISDL
jgi:ketosteroid isomerase-like protein